MSIKSEAQAKAKEFFETHADADKTISASQLAELVKRDAKTVRAHLRKIAARDQKELKGARWRITQTLAASELERVMRLEQKASEQEQAS